MSRIKPNILHIQLQGGLLTACCKSFMQSTGKETSFLHHSSTSVWACSVINMPIGQQITNEHTHITKGGRNGLCCYTRIPWTSIKCLHLCTEVLFCKKRKLETLYPGLQCMMPKCFSRGMFKSSTDFIQFLFNEHSNFDFGLLFQ
jgi:hypothetical protein